MVEIGLLIALALLPLMLPDDPGPGTFRNKTDSRSLDCERLSAEEGRRRFPGLVDAASPRGDYLDRSVVHCQERLMRPGLRLPADEAVLSSLREEADGLAVLLRSTYDTGGTWLVESHYSSAQVAAKITFATKNAMVQQGMAVTDRLPTLAAGDVDVITRMHPDAAYPAACRRYHDNGSLREGDTLLAVISRDPRETILHAGLCREGVWVWLR